MTTNEKDYNHDYNNNYNHDYNYNYNYNSDYNKNYNKDYNKDYNILQLQYTTTTTMISISVGTDFRAGWNDLGNNVSMTDYNHWLQPLVLVLQTRTTTNDFNHLY